MNLSNISLDTLTQMLFDAVSLMALVVLVIDRVIAPVLPAKQKDSIDHLARIANAVEQAVSLARTQPLPALTDTPGMGASATPAPVAVKSGPTGANGARAAEGQARQQGENSLAHDAQNAQYV